MPPIGETNPLQVLLMELFRRQLTDQARASLGGPFSLEAVKGTPAVPSGPFLRGQEGPVFQPGPFLRGEATYPAQVGGPQAAGEGRTVPTWEDPAFANGYGPTVPVTTPARQGLGSFSSGNTPRPYRPAPRPQRPVQRRGAGDFPARGGGAFVDWVDSRTGRRGGSHPAGATGVPLLTVAAIRAWLRAHPGQYLRGGLW